VADDRDGGAELFVLERRAVDAGEHGPAAGARSQQRLCGGAVAPPERRPAAMGIVGAPGGGVIGTLEQQIRHAGERRRDDDERPAMCGDEVRGALDRRRVRERRAAELPDLQGLCLHDSAILLNTKNAI
jgi:hypothetical protein